MTTAKLIKEENKGFVTKHCVIIRTDGMSNHSYKSKACNTPNHAKTLAKRWIKKQGFENIVNWA